MTETPSVPVTGQIEQMVEVGNQIGPLAMRGSF